MSKDREGHEDNDLNPTAGADEVINLDKGADSGLSAAEADAVKADAVEADVAKADAEVDPDITDPETEVADAFVVEAAIEAAEHDVEPGKVAVDADDDVDADAEVAAVGAGSNRAALRKAGARTGVTEKKATPTRSRDDTGAKDSVFSRLSRFIREVVAELRKVIWPSQKQMVTYTIVVITFLIFMIALVAGFDVLFHFGVGKIFG